MSPKLDNSAQQQTPVAKSTNGKIHRKRLRPLVVISLSLILSGVAGWEIWKWAAVPADAPVIGVSFDTAWHARARISTKNYEVALTQAGGRIFELDLERDKPEQVLDRIDALLLTGGGDIDPELYGGDAGDAELVDRNRDDFELALIRGAIQRDMPILGICRGIQILNVAQGGTLKNLRGDPKLSQTHGIGLNSMDAHSATIAPNSKLARILGTRSLRVNSFHGQAVDQVAKGVVIAATSDDGLIEAIELPNQTFVVCTQWHPEVPPQQTSVFEAFLTEAKAYRSRRGQ